MKRTALEHHFIRTVMILIGLFGNLSGTFRGRQAHVLLAIHRGVERAFPIGNEPFMKSQAK